MLNKDSNSQLIQFLPILERILKFLIVFFIVACFLQSQGYSVTSLITGFGITGLAVGFAANSTISSVFGTFSIFSDKAYKIGDYVIVNGVEGTVEDVNLRSTKIRTLDNYLYIVPNSSVANGNICNVSVAKKRRIDMSFGLVYSTSNEMLERAIKIIEEILHEEERIYNDYVVFLDSLSASSIDIRCHAYVKSSAYNSLKKVKSDFKSVFDTYYLLYKSAFPQNVESILRISPFFPHFINFPLTFFPTLQHAENFPHLTLIFQYWGCGT